MDFKVVGLDGLVGTDYGAPIQTTSLFNEVKPKVLRSGLGKQERSECSQDEWRASKILKTDVPKTMSLKQRTHLLRSSSMICDDGEDDDDDATRPPQEHMLSFSSPKSGVPFVGKDDGLLVHMNNLTNNGYLRGYGCGSLSSSMHGHFNGGRGQFTPSQWIELEHQALIYKYITANVPIPSNLLISLKKSVNPFGFTTSSFTSLPPNSLGWGSFHLGFSGNTDPEPGRCRRTDGKKWRCSRDAVADQKYCERHINRGRHRSRKPVESQTGQAASGNTNSKVAPTTSSISSAAAAGAPPTPPPCGGASKSLAVSAQHLQQQPKNMLSGPANTSADVIVNRRAQKHPAPSMVSSTINLKPPPNGPTFAFPEQEQEHISTDKSEFGLVTSDSLLNPSQNNPFMVPKDYSGSYLNYTSQETDEEHPLRHFIDEWPKDESTQSVITWRDELKSDWPQLSMSIPTSSFSPTHDNKLVLSPLRLSREFDPMEMGLGTKPNDWNNSPISWDNLLGGGPLGEALSSTTMASNGGKNWSTLNLSSDGWDQGGGSSPQFSSPTGVLQKSSFGSLSNTSSGSSSMAENKKGYDGASVFSDVLGSTVVVSNSPSL